MVPQSPREGRKSLSDIQCAWLQFFKIFPGSRLLWMPTQGSADAVYGTVDDHDGWGVASGFDPAAGEKDYQAGEIYVSFGAFVSCVFWSVLA